MAGANDHCLVGIIKAGFDYDACWEVFETGDSQVAREMWRKKHGQYGDEDLHAYPYNQEDLARTYDNAPTDPHHGGKIWDQS